MKLIGYRLHLALIFVLLSSCSIIASRSGVPFIGDVVPSKINEYSEVTSSCFTLKDDFCGTYLKIFKNERRGLTLLLMSQREYASSKVYKVTDVIELNRAYGIIELDFTQCTDGKNIEVSAVIFDRPTFSKVPIHQKIGQNDLIYAVDAKKGNIYRLIPQGSEIVCERQPLVGLYHDKNSKAI